MILANGPQLFSAFSVD